MKRAACFATLVLAFASSVHAAPLNNTTGLGTPTSTITFSEVVLTQGTAVTSQYGSLGVSFGGLFYNPSPFFLAANITPPSLGNFSAEGFPPANLTNPFSIFFNQALTGAAFSMVTNDATTTFEALLAGNVVESFVTTTSATQSNNYFGFTGITFDQIRVTISQATFTEAALIDNVQLGAPAPGGPGGPGLAQVPEPGTLALLGLMGVGVAGALRRRRKHAA